MIVANAREASTCSPNQDVDILDHLNIAEIKCLVAYFWPRPALGCVAWINKQCLIIICVHKHKFV